MVFNKAIQKTKHKQLLPDFKKIPAWITKHYRIFIVLFLLLIGPAAYGQANTNVYYDLTLSLPESLKSVTAQNKVADTYDLGSANMILISQIQRRKMLKIYCQMLMM